MEFANSPIKRALGSMPCREEPILRDGKQASSEWPHFKNIEEDKQ